MPEATELWTTVGLILGGILIATTTYFKTNGRSSREEPQQAAMGLFMERETIRNMERNMERIADACEALADKRQDAMSTGITQMLDIMKEREKRDRGS
jgi:hypothetical protein